jgi:hypothetical protein
MMGSGTNYASIYGYGYFICYVNNIQQGRINMYALIYDEHDPANVKKDVLSIHETRETAENALEERKKEMGKSIQECNTHIVWIEKTVNAGDNVKPGEYDTWRSGEEVPHGEMYSDTD